MSGIIPTRATGFSPLIFTDPRLERILQQQRERTDRATEGALNAVAALTREVERNEERERTLRQEVNESRNASTQGPRIAVTVAVSDATARDPEHLYALAEQFLSGEGRRRNPHQALSLYERSANLNFAPAHFRLGEIYRQGQHGFSENIYQAVHHYRRAAELGHLAAMIQLYRATPVKDSFEGALWCGRADYLNSQEATADFCIRYPSADKIDVLADRHFEEAKKLLDDAIRCYREAGEAGHGASYEKLGNFYGSGRIALPLGQTKQQAALENYHNAVSKNTFPPIASFTNHLLTPNDCHLHGDRLYRPYPTAAFACYQKAGDFQGYTKMAAMYVNGLGVPQDIQKAFECYEAAHGKQTTSSFATEICALSEDPVVLESFGDRSADPKVKFACYSKAGCKKKIGDCYAQGIGVEVDREKAFDQYNLTKLDDNALFSSIQALQPTEAEYISWGDRCHNRSCAIRCYQKADNCLSWTKVATMYAAGEGIAKNIQKAFECYETAHAKRTTTSLATEICALSEDPAILESFGDRSADPKVRFACYSKADCKKKIGDCYAQGIGVKVDKGKAFDQYNLTKLDDNALFSSIQALHPSQAEYISWGDLCHNRPCAISCYQQAKAHLKLAEAYRSGDGVTRDCWQAFNSYMDFLAVSSSSLEIPSIIGLTNDREILWRMGLEAEHRGQPLIADACFQKGEWGLRLLEESKNTSLSLDLRRTRYLQAGKCGVQSTETVTSLISTMNTATLIQFKNQANSERFEANVVAATCQNKIKAQNKITAQNKTTQRRRKKKKWGCEIS